MTVTVKHSKTNAITDWTQAQLDEQIALGNFPAGTTLAKIVLPSDWNNDHTLTGVGTMAEQDASAVAITGGSVNNTTIGATTATTGKFTTLSASGAITSTIATGTAPFTVASTTNVANLNASSLNGATFASPGAIGGTTAAAGTFTSVTTPSVTATTTNLNFYPVSTGNVIVNQSSGGAFGLVLAQDISTPTNSARLFFDSNVNVASIRNNAGGGLAISTGATIGSTSGAVQFQASHTASAVNWVQVTGAATGGFVTISAQGSDSNPGIYYTTKGFGSHRFTTNTGGGSEQFRIITNSASTVNFLQVNGSATTLAPQFSAQGTDTNISMAFQPKGTGAIDLSVGSSGVNISNGNTVTGITRTVTGSGYSTMPTVSIAVPTTAGGVQATVGTINMFSSGVTIVSGGTGYTVNDILTVVGGTPTIATQLTVTTVSSGVITGVSIVANTGGYTALPTNPASVTGGTGTSATFNFTYGLNSLTILTAGSGYIEQPTVTISGGGGSGASAYATVGGNSIVRGLGSTTSFYTPGGEAFRLVDNSQTSNSYWGALGSSANSPSLRSFGTSTANIDNNAAAGINFRTNLTSASAVQMFIAHTASAVNYVQVTGAATGSGPIISTQGSDTNATLTLRSKGTFAVTMQSSAGANIFEAIPTASSVNYLRVAPSIASSAPTLSAQGTDTNIDLALTPKGTGRVKFGTYTVSAGLVTTGYVEILDSGGTVRRLAVV